MKVELQYENVIVSELDHFNLEQTMECGQCFHFVKLANQEYGLTAFGRLLHVQQKQDTLIFYHTTMETFESVWKKYFDLETDYKQIQDTLLLDDDHLLEAITSMNGVRILKQDFFETLLSFIISQNKQIPHIKKIVADISLKYGTYLGTLQDIPFYAFPTPEQMRTVSEAQLRECKTGFRAPYICDAVRMVNEKQIRQMDLLYADKQTCEQMLTKIKGVGVKVANCVMLFSLDKMDAFPVDVWIKRIMEVIYFEGEKTPNAVIAQYAKDHFKEYGGYAQQYLFYYGKTIKMGVGSSE